MTTATFQGWAFPLIVAHYRIYGDPDSWNSYGEKHVVIDTGEVMPEYRDWPNFYHLKRRKLDHVDPHGREFGLACPRCGCTHTRAEDEEVKRRWRATL